MEYTFEGKWKSTKYPCVFGKIRIELITLDDHEEIDNIIFVTSDGFYKQKEEAYDVVCSIKDSIITIISDLDGKITSYIGTIISLKDEKFCIKGKYKSQTYNDKGTIKLIQTNSSEEIKEIKENHLEDIEELEEKSLDSN
jgi:peroxiredoxin